MLKMDVHSYIVTIFGSINRTKHMRSTDGCVAGNLPSVAQDYTGQLLSNNAANMSTSASGKKKMTHQRLDRQRHSELHSNPRQQCPRLGATTWGASRVSYGRLQMYRTASARTGKSTLKRDDTVWPPFGVRSYSILANICLFARTTSPSSCQWHIYIYVLELTNHFGSDPYSAIIPAHGFATDHIITF
jgi:hypothetical protein